MDSLADAAAGSADCLRGLGCFRRRPVYRRSQLSFAIACLGSRDSPWVDRSPGKEPSLASALLFGLRGLTRRGWFRILVEVFAQTSHWPIPWTLSPPGVPAGEAARLCGSDTHFGAIGSRVRFHETVSGRLPARKCALHRPTHDQQAWRLASRGIHGQPREAALSRRAHLLPSPGNLRQRLAGQKFR
jgi:hypothetical protein